MLGGADRRLPVPTDTEWTDPRAESPLSSGVGNTFGGPCATAVPAECFFSARNGGMIIGKLL